MKKKHKTLLALLSDGKNLSEADAAAIKLYNVQRRPIAVQGKPPTISKLSSDENIELALSVLYFALQRKDEKLTKRAIEIARRYGIVDTHKALLLLKAAIGSEVSMIKALHAFFDPPPVVSQVQELLQPQQYVSVSGVNPKDYRHPDDITETEKLKERQGFESLARYLSKHIAERAQAIQNAGGAIAVGPNQYPDLHQRYKRIAERLGVFPLPPLYLSKGGINAFTSGVEEPFISISQGAVDTLKPSELDFVLGHELGHVHFDHVLYQMIARMGMAQGFMLSPSFLVGRLISGGMALSIAKWSRMAELSCDRAGLLACQNEKSALSTLLRFAGAPTNRMEELNIDAFLEQQVDLEKAANGPLGSALSGLDKSHPWITQRVKALREWIDSGEYAAVLAKGNDNSDASLQQNPTLEKLKSALSWANKDPELATKLQRSAAEADCREWDNLLTTPYETLQPLSELRLQHAISLDDLESDLREEVSSLKRGYQTWFRQMTEDDRRHTAPQKLREELMQLIVKCVKAHRDRLPTSWPAEATTALHLKSKSDVIPKASIAAGIGQLGYGALLLPTAPVWMLVAGVGIGVASAAASKQQKKKAVEEKLTMHCKQVEEWLEVNVNNTMKIVVAQGKKYLEELENIDKVGWIKSISEIRMQIKALQTAMG